MYATCASETSSCRLLLLRGGAEAEGEAVVDDDAEAERENKERRRKMRVTELNIVRMVGWLDLVNEQKKRLICWNWLFVATGFWISLIEGTITRVGVFM